MNNKEIKTDDSKISIKDNIINTIENESYTDRQIRVCKWINRRAERNRRRRDKQRK